MFFILYFFPKNKSFSFKKIEIFILPGWRFSPILNVDMKNPNGYPPIPNDMWNPPSPKPRPENPVLLSGSVLCPTGRGGTLFLFKKKKTMTIYLVNMIIYF